MEKFQFRNLMANEIECRVGTVTERGCSLLLYKDARCDMALMDEVFGPMGWKRCHEMINGNLFCTVSVYDKETGVWVSKQDVGVESNTEKEKGQASDAFKRACVNWGIGRELYTAPFVWINLSADEWKQGVNGRKQPKPTFRVKAIEYNNKTISHLVIEDNKGVQRFAFGTTSEYETAVSEVLRLVKQAVSREELTRIYKEQPGLHKEQRFVEALNDRAKELDNAA